MLDNDKLADADARLNRSARAAYASHGAGTTDGREEDETSLLEMWDHAGFDSPGESAKRFGELLVRMSDTEHAGEAGIEAIARIAETFADAGRADEALVAGEHLARVFRSPVSLVTRDRIGRALVTIAERLLDHDLPEPAARLSADTESLLDDAESPTLQVSLAAAILNRTFALKQQAFASGDGSLMEAAVAAGAALEQRFGRSRDAQLREIVVMGTYNVAGALGALGRIDEAAARFSELAASYGDDPDPTLRQFGQFATVRQRMMLATPDVPPYVTEHPLETSYRADPDEFAAPGGWEERRDERAAAAVKSHQAAAGILANYRLSGAPFALFLRSFDAEGWAGMTAPAFETETGLPAQVVSFASVAPSSVEQQLADAVEGRGAVLGVANRDSLVASAWVVPRLFLPDAGWQETVQALIRAAHLIVLHVAEMTAGVRWELACIQASERMPSTVLVLQDTDEEELLLAESWRERGGSRPSSGRSRSRPSRRQNSRASIA